VAASDDQLRALGRITANFQLLEMLLALWTGVLIKTDQAAGFMITSQLSFRRLCALMGTMFRHRIVEVEARSVMERLLKQAAQIEERRNAFVHSTWSNPDQQSKTARGKIILSKDGVRVHTEKLSSDEMNHVGDSISELIKELNAFMSDLQQRGLIVSNLPE
jgi:hypothetical protein